MAAKSRIAGFKVPKTLEVSSNPLPKSAAGKILKRDLQIAAFKALLMQQARQIDKLQDALRFAYHRSNN